MPPFAPVAAAAAVQNNVLPVPPNSGHDIVQHVPNFNEALHQNMNPFRNDLNLVKQNLVDHQVDLPDLNQHRYAPGNNLYHVNGVKAQNALNSLYNLHKSDDADNAAEEGKKHLYVPHGNQFHRVAHVAPFIKSGIKNLNIVPLDGDVNQHSDLEVQGGNPFVDLDRHNQDSAHG